METVVLKDEYVEKLKQINKAFTRQHPLGYLLGQLLDAVPDDRRDESYNMLLKKYEAVGQLDIEFMIESLIDSAHEALIERGMITAPPGSSVPDEQTASVFSQMDDELWRRREAAKRNPS